MSTLRVNEITGKTGTGGSSSPIALSGDTATLGASVTVPAAGVSGTLGSGVVIPAAGVSGTLGSGVVIPAAGITGTLGSGVVFPVGHVLQVVQGTSNTLDSTDSGTYVDSGLSASFIPASEDNNVLIIAMTCSTATVSDDYAGCTIFRGTAATWNQTDLAANSYGFSNMLSFSNALVTSVTMTYLDSPNTDVSVKYTMGHRAWAAGATSIVQTNSVTATMILMEIQG